MRDPRFNDEQRAMICGEILLAEESALNSDHPQQVWYDPVDDIAYTTSFSDDEFYSEIEAEYFERSILILCLKRHDLKDIYGNTNTDVDWNNPEYWRTPEYDQLQYKFLHDKENGFNAEEVLDMSYTLGLIATHNNKLTKK